LNNGILVRTDQFTVKLATTERELAAAQRLRFQMFYEERGLLPDGEGAFTKRDADHFDPFCDHLLVIENTPDPADLRVVGTYRLLPEDKARAAGGFISSSEFDLAPLINFVGRKVELGRACVHPGFRSKAVMQLLWRGIAEYVTRDKVGLLMGAASFPGTDPDDFKLALSYLHYFHRAPREWRPSAHPFRYLDLKLVSRKRLDIKKAFLQMPPLLKGYLRVGAVIGDGAVIDWRLKTLDVCLMVDTSVISERYRAHYLEKPPEAHSETQTVIIA